MRITKTLIRLSLRWTHISEGTFSHVVALPVFHVSHGLIGNVTNFHFYSKSVLFMCDIHSLYSLESKCFRQFHYWLFINRFNITESAFFPLLFDVIASTLRKHTYSNILKISSPKMEKNSDKKFWYFSYFCSKHRLWVLVRTALARRFLRVPIIYVLSRNKKNNVTPCKLQFYYIKVVFKGVKII